MKNLLYAILKSIISMIFLIITIKSFESNTQLVMINNYWQYIILLFSFIAFYYPINDTNELDSSERTKIKEKSII